MRAAGILLLLAPLTLAAQERARFGGVVRDVGGAPIGDAGVQLMPGNLNTRTNADGRFAFDSLVPGKYFLRIRRLGFNPFVDRVSIRADTVVDLVLDRRTHMLDTIVVTDKCSRFEFSGFLCRRAKGQGIFFTEEDILAKNPQYIPDVFRNVNGFRLEPLLTAYGQMRTVRANETRCITELLDGRRPIMTGQTVASGPRHARRYLPVTMHDFYRPGDLIGVEAYPPGTPLPEEYAIRASGSRYNNTNGHCLLVIYWTGHSLPKPKK